MSLATSMNFLRGFFCQTVNISFILCQYTYTEYHMVVFKATFRAILTQFNLLIILAVLGFFLNPKCCKQKQVNTFRLNSEGQQNLTGLCGRLELYLINYLQRLLLF